MMSIACTHKQREKTANVFQLNSLNYCCLATTLKSCWALINLFLYWIFFFSSRSFWALLFTSKTQFILWERASGGKHWVNQVFYRVSYEYQRSSAWHMRWVHDPHPSLIQSWWVWGLGNSHPREIFHQHLSKEFISLILWIISSQAVGQWWHF